MFVDLQVFENLLDYFYRVCALQVISHPPGVVQPVGDVPLSPDVHGGDSGLSDCDEVVLSHRISRGKGGKSSAPRALSPDIHGGDSGPDDCDEDVLSHRISQCKGGKPSAPRALSPDVHGGDSGPNDCDEVVHSHRTSMGKSGTPSLHRERSSPVLAWTSESDDGHIYAHDLLPSPPPKVRKVSWIMRDDSPDLSADSDDSIFDSDSGGDVVVPPRRHRRVVPSSSFRCRRAIEKARRHGADRRIADADFVRRTRDVEREGPAAFLYRIRNLVQEGEFEKPKRWLPSVPRPPPGVFVPGLKYYIGGPNIGPPPNIDKVVEGQYTRFYIVLCCSKCWVLCRCHHGIASPSRCRGQGM